MKPVVMRIVTAIISAILMAGAVLGGVSLVLRLLEERERAMLSGGVVTVEDRQEGEGAQPFTLYERIDMLSGSLSIQTASRPPYNTEASLEEAANAANSFLAELMAVFCDERGRFTPEGMTFGEKMALARVNAYLVDITSAAAGDMRMSVWLVEYTWGQPAPGMGPEPTPAPIAVLPGEEWTRLTSAQLALDSVNLQPYAAVYHFEGEHPSVAFAEARAKEESKLAALHMDEYNEEYNLETSMAHAQVFARAVDMERSLAAPPRVTELAADQFPLWHSMAPVMSGLGLWAEPQVFCRYDLGGGLQVLTNDLTGGACAVALYVGELETLIRFSYDDYIDMDVYWETAEEAASEAAYTGR